MAENGSEEFEFGGVSHAEWERAFSQDIVEFAATRFIFTFEDQGQVRIAFGNRGPFTDALGNRSSPRYTHAVTLPPDVAVEFARLILKHFARPTVERFAEGKPAED